MKSVWAQAAVVMLVSVLVGVFAVVGGTLIFTQ